MFAVNLILYRISITKLKFNNSLLSLQKRYVGGKPPIGHAHKLLQSAANKPNLTDLPAASQANISYKPAVQPTKNVQTNKQPFMEKEFKKVDTFTKTTQSSAVGFESTANKVPKGMPLGKYSLFHNNVSEPVPLGDLVKADIPKLKSKSGNEYTTEITEKTTPKDISDKNLILEMKTRELVKADTGNTAVIIKDANNNNTIVGDSKNGIKLTPLGQAYSATIPNKTDTNTLTDEQRLEVLKEQPFIFDIVLPPKPNGNIFIETGKQKHLLIIRNSITSDAFSIGYLTSKLSGIHLSNMQFKKFQENLDNADNKKEFEKNPSKAEKSPSKSDKLMPVKHQYLFEFDTMQRIMPQDLVAVKGSKEYLDHIDKNSLFSAILENLIENTYEDFNKSGVTKETCIAMCVAHDKVAKKGASHPLTADQIKTQEAAKAKQKEEQEKKKLAKSKLNKNIASDTEKEND